MNIDRFPVIIYNRSVFEKGGDKVSKENKNPKTKEVPPTIVFGTIDRPGSPEEVFLARIGATGKITEWKPLNEDKKRINQ